MVFKSILLISLVASHISAYHRCSVGGGQKKGTIRSRRLDETSGLAYSRRSRQVLWVHNDSDGSRWINAITEQGTFNVMFVYNLSNKILIFLFVREENSWRQVAWYRKYRLGGHCHQH